MLDAIHKNTNKEYFAPEIWKLFKTPNKEEWICCPDCKKPVTPVRGYNRKTPSGFTTLVVSHFRIKEKNTGGCIHGESDEHKKKKILIATLIENKKITLKIKHAVISFNNLNIKNVPRLPYRWEQKRGERVGDVLFEFETWHPILGKGINFEIRVSETKSNGEYKEYDWCKNGYSLSWLDKEDFEDFSLKITEINITNPWCFTFFEIMEETKDIIQDAEIELSEKIKAYEDYSRKTCRTCKHGRKDRNNSDIIVCFLNWKSFKKITKHEQMDGCRSHEN